MTRKTLFVALALALPASGALAQNVNNGVSWSYFDFGVQRVAPDSSDLDDGNGFGIRGSGAINQNWHVFLGYNRTQLEGSRAFRSAADAPGVVGIDDDLDRYNIGIGYNLPIASNTDLFARAAYERAGSAEFDVLIEGLPAQTAKLDSTDGYSVEVGVRSAFTPRFEAGAAVRYLSFDDPDVRLGDQRIETAGLVDDGATSLVLNGQFKFGNGWGIVGEGEIGSEYNALFLGARLSY
jgi:opacity protein-like surface antigen